MTANVQRSANFVRLLPWKINCRNISTVQQVHVLSGTLGSIGASKSETMVLGMLDCPLWPTPGWRGSYWKSSGKWSRRLTDGWGLGLQYCWVALLWWRELSQKPRFSVYLHAHDHRWGLELGLELGLTGTDQQYKWLKWVSFLRWLNLAYLSLGVHQITYVAIEERRQSRGALREESLRCLGRLTRTLTHASLERTFRCVHPGRTSWGDLGHTGKDCISGLGKPWERSVPDSDPDTGQKDEAFSYCFVCTASAHMSAGHTSTYRLRHICSNMNTKGEKIAARWMERVF